MQETQESAVVPGVGQLRSIMQPESLKIWRYGQVFQINFKKLNSNSNVYIIIYDLVT